MRPIDNIKANFLVREQQSCSVFKECAGGGPGAFGTLRWCVAAFPDAHELAYYFNVRFSLWFVFGWSVLN